MSPACTASVVVPALNAEATLPDLLAALKAQAGVAGPYEIIVVDNGSTDRTADIASSCGVTLLRQPIRGPAAARNMGLSHARAEIIACTDSDTIPTRRWLASLLSAFGYAETIQVTGPILGWQPTTAAERFVSARRVFDPERTAAHPIHPFAHGMNVAVRRSAALEIGGWDQTMTSGEDVDFSIRLRKRFGSDIRFIEQALLFHRHPSTDEALWRQARWHGAGYALVHQRHQDVLPWSVWRSGIIYASLTALHIGAPFVAAARAVRLFSEQRAEFERYHRQWARHFWSAFFEEWKKRAA